MKTHSLGGSEKAVVYLSRNLPKNYDIYISGTVKDETNDNITYIHHDKLQDLLNKEVFHTIIVSRYICFFEKYVNIKCYQLIISTHDTDYINSQTKNILSTLLYNCERIDNVVTLTDWHKNLISQKYSCIKDKMCIINNGIDISKFPKNKEKVKNKFIWSSCSERGLHILLNLWEDILQKLPDATLDICSYNKFPKTDADRKMLEIINKHSSIIHHGKLDTTQLYDLMNVSEYWLYTNTISETSCITGMEMLMSNVICIYYPLAGLVNTVGKYGIPVEKGNEIETILSLTEKQKVEIIEKGKQYALKCSWRNRAKEWSKMLNLDNNFIKIINLTRRTDRKNKMKQKLESNNLLCYNFVNAIDGKKLEKNNFLVEMFKGNNFSNRRGVIGCALSHYYIWKELLKDNNNDFYVILEDDIEFCDNFSQQLKNIQCDLKNKDMVFLGYSMFEQKRQQHLKYNDSNIDAFIQKLNRELYIGGFFMYSINKNGAHKMINYIKKNGIKEAIDSIILKSSIELYETVPQLSFSKWNENGITIDTDIQHDYSYDTWLE
jgi:GR25 family glycosyltransferase involved in LPS biosynthesis